MQRAFLSCAAFTITGAVFAGTLIVAGLLFGTPARTGGEPSSSPSASAPAVGGPVGEIAITEFDLGFEPAMVHVEDGWTLPTPHFEDTVLVAPGERIDVIVEATEVGTWAFHCHVLTHAEGPDGMFGMVTALIVQE
jgi:hypothetical protein